MTLNGTVESDAAAFIDPYVFCIGFLLTATGLMLSQVHRDEAVLLPRRSGLPFNLLRKTSGLEMPVGVILGFWIVGIWWLLWLPVLVVASGIPVRLLRNARHRLPMTIAAMATGLLLAFWAQGPTLVRMGILPRVF